MRVDVSYADGRLESFDTDRFTRAEPFAAKSMLADLALAFCEDGSLVLRADCYDVRDVGDGAMARRRRGWAFLLVSCEEAPQVLSVAVDGTVRWSRVGPDLADVGRLRALGAMWHPGGGSTAQLAVWLHDLACQAHPGLLGTRDGEDELRISVRPRRYHLRCPGVEDGGDDDEVPEGPWKNCRLAATGNTKAHDMGIAAGIRSVM